MQSLLRKYIFPLLLFVVVGLAVAFPQQLFASKILYGGKLTQLSVAIIFFLQGYSLPNQSLAKGYRPLRLHGFVLFWNFIFFPVVALLLIYPMGRILSMELLLGFGILAFLPTTIASATAYTAIANGNVANAIVSTVLSNVLAIFVVPVVSVIYLRLELSIDISPGKMLLSLIFMLVIPLVLGQIVQRFVRLNRERTTKVTRQISAGLILLIVYMAFARSMRSGVFEKLSFESLMVTLFAVIILLLVANVLVWVSAFWMKLEMPQRIAAFYCGSQKSLAAGLPLVSSILLSIPDLKESAMIFIPLLLFHPLQMLLAGVLSSRLKFKNNAA